jgi:hypothetical protein
MVAYFLSHRTHVAIVSLPRAADPLELDLPDSAEMGSQLVPVGIAHRGTGPAQSMDSRRSEIVGIVR